MLTRNNNNNNNNITVIDSAPMAKSIRVCMYLYVYLCKSVHKYVCECV